MTERFQILSLDGGGIKGLFSAAVLAHFEDDLKIKVTDHFDLIVGTSTGGIIALALGIGMRPREIVDFYIEKGRCIFPQHWHLIATHWLINKYGSSSLKKALQECFGEKCLADCSKKLVVPSYNISQDDVYIFKTPHHERFTRDHRVPLWKVAMATSAAPSFFPAFQEVDNCRLVDGGVWANNPTMVGIIEAKSVLDIPLDAIKVFSLGTTNGLKGRPKLLNRGGKLLWARQAVEVIMRGQSIGAFNQALHLLGKENVYRIDPMVPDKLFKLDKIANNDLLSLAGHISRVESDLFKSKFMDHIAPEFVPFHSDRRYSNVR